MTTQPTRLEVRANMKLTDSQWLLDVMGRYDFTIPSVAFDEIINRIELLSESKPAAPKGWMRDALAYIEAGIESEGPLEAEHSIEARRLIATAPAAPAQSAQPVGWRMRWPNSHVDPNYWSAQFSNDPAYCRVMMQEYTARGAIVELIYSAPQPSPTAVVLDDELNKRIREIFLANGFTIKEGQTDLKPYVYQAAYALLWATGAMTLPSVAQPVEQTRALTEALEQIIELHDIDASEGKPLTVKEQRMATIAAQALTAARPASGETE